MTDLALIVPARLASVRFPRKLLHPLRGKPLILWTAERLRQEVPEMPLTFAVAETELADVLGAAGFASVMTDPALASGTDRVAAANAQVGARWVINVQADEPLVSRSHLQSLARLLQDGAAMATLATPFASESDFRDPNKVKVVCGAQERALYFSRAPIPADRDQPGAAWRAGLWHMGLYGYTAQYLRDFTALPPSPLEQREKLEQLRALEAGWDIRVGVVEERHLGVDTPEDAVLLEKLL